MTGCTATIHSISCNDHDALAEMPHGNPVAGLRWDDRAPGASPHRDPEPSYAVWGNNRGDWVVRRGGRWAVIFSVDRHPDPQGAAEAEAQCLNGESPLTVNAEAHEWAMLRLGRYRGALEKIAHRSLGADLSTYRDYALRVLDGGQP